ncbi:MAG: phage major capsid protein [Candidatus Dehalobacter alkaniphilus]
MNKEKLLSLINSKQAKMDELVKRSNATENVEELRGIKTDMESLNKDTADLRSMLEEVEAEEQRAAQTQQKKTILATYVPAKNTTDPDVRNTEPSDLEKRAAAFKESKAVEINPMEMRSITVAAGTLATPTNVQTKINDGFNEVSSIVDMVKITDAQGMGEYQVPYISGYGTGGIKTEGQDYAESDPTFDYATLKPVKITIYTEVSDETTKLTPVNYLAKVQEAALVALRKKVAKLIPVGNPSATPAEITGITNATAITASATTFVAIDEKTLRKIAMSYGGDENIVGNAVLQVNKNDLIAFGDVRGSDKKAVYEITPDASNPNAGIIKDGGLSVRYIINSALPALSATGTAADSLCMIYGVPSAYELALFSPYNIKVSTEAAFKKGMIAVRGEVMVGGNVVAANGFELIKKVAA